MLKLRKPVLKHITGGVAVSSVSWILYAISRHPPPLIRRRCGVRGVPGGEAAAARPGQGEASDL